MRAKRPNGRDRDRSHQAKAIPGRVRLNHVKVPQTLPSKPDLIRENCSLGSIRPSRALMRDVLAVFDKPGAGIDPSHGRRPKGYQALLKCLGNTDEQVCAR